MNYNAVFYVFKPNSSLQLFINKKINFVAKRFTLFNLLTTIKNIIRDEKLFDPNNPSIILCSTDLENVLQKKALHVRDLRNIVLKQLVPKPKLVVSFSFKQLLNRQTQLNSDVIVQFKFQTHKSANHFTLKKPLRKYIGIPQNHEKFTITPAFYSILTTLPNFKHYDKKFTFKQIVHLFEKYVEQKNIYSSGIIYLDSDPLGQVFNVVAIHVSQINLFVLKHVVPIIENENNSVCQCF